MDWWAVNGLNGSKCWQFFFLFSPKRDRGNRLSIWTYNSTTTPSPSLPYPLCRIYRRHVVTATVKNCAAPHYRPGQMRKCALLYTRIMQQRQAHAFFFLSLSLKNICSVWNPLAVDRRDVPINLCISTTYLYTHPPDRCYVHAVYIQPARQRQNKPR